MISFFSGIFTYDFSLGTDFTQSNKVPSQFRNLKKAMQRHELTLSHLKELDKRRDEQDVSQAVKNKLLRTAYMVFKHSFQHEHYELLVHLQTMNGVKLGGKNHSFHVVPKMRDAIHRYFLKQ